MSIMRRESVSLTICCDGPCGTTLGGESPNLPKIPAGWQYLSFGPAAPANGSPNYTKRALLCTECAKAAVTILGNRFAFISNPGLSR